MRKALTPLYILLLLLVHNTDSAAQTIYRVMSYNVENLFDTNLSQSNDDREFQPNGKRRWNKGRYYHKLQQIAKVIAAAGEWDTPALVGLCEVENDTVIRDLISRTTISRQDYRYCITTGEDRRGINTALLYQRDKFKYLHHTEHRIPFSDPGRKSRHILHVSGRIVTQDTLDVLVCHFPSRYGGEKETEQARAEAATFLRALCDSIQRESETRHLLILGDFNDIPQDRSLSKLLKALPLTDDAQSGKAELFNLFYQAKGSHKYQDRWSQLDQIIINSRLRQHLVPSSIQVFAPAFLLTKDKSWNGLRPLRTYHGYKYEKGFSDHLPVLADFRF